MCLQKYYPAVLDGRSLLWFYLTDNISHSLHL